MRDFICLKSWVIELIIEIKDTSACFFANLYVFINKTYSKYYKNK